MSARRTIGEFFRKFREASGREKASVAKYLGLADVATLTGYESGELTIPSTEVFAMVNLYNIPPDQITTLFYNLVCDLESAGPVAASGS